MQSLFHKRSSSSLATNDKLSSYYNALQKNKNSIDKSPR